MSAPCVEPHSAIYTKVIHHTRNLKVSPLEVAADEIIGDIIRDKIHSSVIARASNRHKSAQGYHAWKLR